MLIIVDALLFCCCHNCCFVLLLFGVTRKRKYLSILGLYKMEGDGRRVLTSDELQGYKIVYMFFFKVTISHLIFKMDDKCTTMHEVQF